MMKLLATVLLTLSLSAQADLRRTSANTVRRLNVNTDLINEALKASLGVINPLIQAQIEDPIAIDQTATTEIGVGLSGTACDAEVVTLTASLTELTGGKSTQIESITVREGTENVDACCTGTTFSGTFDIILSAESYAVTGLADLTVPSGACALAEPVPFDGTVENPAFTVVASMSGDIAGGSATIQEVSVISIAATCDRTGVSIDLSGTDFQSIASEVEAGVGNEFKTFVQETMVTIIEVAIELGITLANLRWNFPTRVSYIGRFYRANFRSNIQSIFGLN